MCPEKEGTLLQNVTIKVSSNLHIICLWVPSMCGENIKKTVGPVQIKAESMSTCRISRLGHYEGLCFCISSCAQKKKVLCSKM